jgi:hypothetical protein
MSTLPDPPKYLFFATMLSTSSYSEVAAFASVVSNNISLLYDGTFPMEQFDDGMFIDVPDGLSEEETLQRNSINYIKQCVIWGLAAPETSSYEL